MAPTATEQMHDRAMGLDARAPHEILSILLTGQQAAVLAVQTALPQISDAAKAMADAYRNGGTLIYGAAGSSGLMALADAAELAGTYGTDPARVRFHMAGGVPQNSEMPGDTEDDQTSAEAAGKAARPGDVAIILTARGSTPYALTLASTARAAGATTICIANNPGAAIFDHSDIAICLPTPPEVIAGSTRMGAGTAQKVTLNMMSTLMGVHLGGVHDGMMVNVRADNAKLRARAAGMVAQIAETSATEAARYLDSAGGSVKQAVLLAKGAPTLAAATALLTESNDQLRAALARL